MHEPRPALLHGALWMLPDGPAQLLQAAGALAWPPLPAPAVSSGRCLPSSSSSASLSVSTSAASHCCCIYLY